MFELKHLWTFANIVVVLLVSKIILTVLWKSGKRKIELPGIFNLWDMIRYGLWREIGKPNYFIMDKLHKIFGPVFVFNFSSHNTVCVADLELAKQIMSSPNCLNRLPEDHIVYERSNKKSSGILFGNSENWAFSRKIAVKALENIGHYDGSPLENFVSNEVRDMLEKLEGAIENTGSFHPRGFFNVFATSHLLHNIAGLSHSYDDPVDQDFYRYFHHLLQQCNFGATFVHTFNWLRYIPGITEHDTWVQGHDKLLKIFKEIVEEKRVRKEYIDKPRDFIDHFLQQMDLQKSSAGEHKKNLLNDETLLTICSDLTLAGVDSIGSTLEFAISFMALNPHVQEKVQEEINSFFGSDCLPSLNFKNNMTYTEATSLEIFRHSSILPLTSRCPALKTTINGTEVTKNTQIVINHFAIHFSSNLWCDPKEFRPERFLNEDGTKIINAANIMPFGFGKRKCIGERAARSTFFLFFTSLLQKFTFSVSSIHGPPSLEHLVGLARGPKPYFVSVKKRENK